MSKIVGNTVGMGLPKPNLMQNDPTKGDYVKGKEEFLKMDISALIDNKVGDLRSYVASVFEELKELIQNGDIESAVAILDEAILDVSVLA